MKKLTSILSIFIATHLSAASWYISQSGAGLGSGISLANAGSVAFFDTARNWGIGHISPGDTVHLEGTITSPLTIEGSGTTGSPTTIIFDPGASMQAPVWPVLTGAINLNSKNYITVDGGALGMIGGRAGNPGRLNGFIENTANGTALANQSPSIFIYGPGSSNITVQNLGLFNLYVRTSTTDSKPGAGALRSWSTITNFYNGSAVPSNWKVTNCLIHDAYSGFFTTYGTGASSVEYSFCTVYNCNWGGNCGDYGKGATLSSLLVHDNWIHDFACWDDTTGANAFHHDGFFGWGVSGGTLTTIRYYNNTIGPNFGASTAGGLFVQGWVTDVSVYDNLFLENASDGPADGLIYLNPYPDIAGTYSAWGNTFVGGGTSTGINYALDGVAGHTTLDAQTINLQGNLISGTGTAIALYSINPSITLNVNYNLGCNLKSGQQYSYSTTNAASFKTFSQWQALGYDINGLSWAGLSNFTP